VFQQGLQTLGLDVVPDGLPGGSYSRRQMHWGRWFPWC
jgi:hypothetical protein